MFVCYIYRKGGQCRTYLCTYSGISIDKKFLILYVSVVITLPYMQQVHVRIVLSLLGPVTLYALAYLVQYYVLLERCETYPAVMVKHITRSVLIVCCVCSVSVGKVFFTFNVLHVRYTRTTRTSRQSVT